MPDFIVALLSYIHTGSISNIGIIILIVLSLIQIAPIKFNLYYKFFSWLREKLVEDLDERLNSVWVNFTDSTFYASSHAHLRLLKTWLGVREA